MAESQVGSLVYSEQFWVFSVQTIIIRAEQQESIPEYHSLVNFFSLIF